MSAASPLAQTTAIPCLHLSKLPNSIPASILIPRLSLPRWGNSTTLFRDTPLAQAQPSSGASLAFAPRRQE